MVASIVDEESLSAGMSVLELDSGTATPGSPALAEPALSNNRHKWPADLVVDLHHLMHETSLDSVLAAHRARLAPGGRLVCEFFYARPLVQQRLVDTIRHGHFLYLSLSSFIPALARQGLTATRAVEVDVYGGSLRVTARASEEGPPVDQSVPRVLEAERAAGLDEASTVHEFADDARLVAGGVRSYLENLAAAGRTVAGYGAPSKAAVLLALAGVDQRTLPFTVDLSPAKEGRRIPGAAVPIRRVDSLLSERPDVVVVLTWDIADEIIAQLERLATGTEWDPVLYVPLPTPREVRLAVQEQAPLEDH